MTTKTYTNLTELLNGECADTPFRFGRHLYKYVDCGPWVTYVLGNAGPFPLKDVYYEDEMAHDIDWFDICSAVRIGSIVEGSDAEVGPIELSFPFTSDQLWAAVEEVNSEACGLWDEANEDNGNE